MVSIIFNQPFAAYWAGEFLFLFYFDLVNEFWTAVFRSNGICTLCYF